MKENLILVAGFVLHISLAVNGCFITNCPPGGKRSGSETSIKQCETCGPPGMNGLCYGPHICCSADGCMIGTLETLACLQENLLRNTPCQNPGESCSGNDEANLNGQCVSPGICCSSETCTMDDTCHGPVKDQASHSSHSFPSKEHLTIFQSPLNRWIPRRLGLTGHGQRNEPKKSTGSRPFLAENPFTDHMVVIPDNLKISNEEYY